MHAGALRLIQLRAADGTRMVGVTREGATHRLKEATSIYALAQRAIEADLSLEQLIGQLGLAEPLELGGFVTRRQILSPIDHADPAHVWLTGTGLTHLGSADARDRMHANAQAVGASDSMKMFRLGLEGGKVPGGGPGVQPEWFYKGNGYSLVPPEAPLTSPPFALDGSEEPELAGIYVIGPQGTPFRIGYALANEFSDHVMERQNYLYLAHSKLRPASIGPELFVGELPADIRGTTRVRRGTDVLWEKTFLTGEDNMSHHIRNLEHHHFKYDLFRAPGDVHVHFFGTATLSFSDGVKVQDGDVFEIEAPSFGLPLRNSLLTTAAVTARVRSL